MTAVKKFKAQRLAALRKKLKEANYLLRIYSLKHTSVQNDIADLESRIAELSGEAAGECVEGAVKC